MCEQHAALIYCNTDKDKGDISRQVVAVLRFSIPLTGAEHLMCPVTSLFPPPDRDPFFDVLLSSTPYVPHSPRHKGQDRPIPIPEYYDTTKFRRSDLWLVYRARDREVPLPFFHQALRSAKSANGKRLGSFEPFSCFTSRGRRDVRRAVAIYNLSSVNELIAHLPPPHAQFTGASSVFFEYGPMQADHGKDCLVLPIGMPTKSKGVDFRFYFVGLPTFGAFGSCKTANVGMLVSMVAIPKWV